MLSCRLNRPLTLGRSAASSSVAEELPALLRTVSAPSSSLLLMPRHVSSLAMSQQRRSIRIQQPDPDIKTYWRKETENIRAKHEGIPLGSAEVEGEAFKEYIQMKTANGNVIDSYKLAKWFCGVMFFGCALPMVIGTEPDDPGAEYTPYVKPKPQETMSIAEEVAAAAAAAAGGEASATK